MKSPPELWAEVSSEDTLGRHLAEFGEIRITRVDPETTVAWEGDRASGTVELAPAGWGTKVVLTATATEQEAVVAEPEPQPPAPEPVAAVVVAPARRGFFARLFGRRAPAAVPAPIPPTPAPDPSPQIRADALGDERTVAILTEVLDDLGAAHHRPFSRD